MKQTDYESSVLDAATKHITSRAQQQKDAIEEMHSRIWEKTPAQCMWEAFTWRPRVSVRREDALHRRSPIQIAAMELPSEMTKLTDKRRACRLVRANRASNSTVRSCQIWSRGHKLSGRLRRSLPLARITNRSTPTEAQQKLSRN